MSREVLLKKRDVLAESSLLRDFRNLVRALDDLACEYTRQERVQAAVDVQRILAGVEGLQEDLSGYDGNAKQVCEAIECASQARQLLRTEIALAGELEDSIRLGAEINADEIEALDTNFRLLLGLYPKSFSMLKRRDLAEQPHYSHSQQNKARSSGAAPGPYNLSRTDTAPPSSNQASESGAPSSIRAAAFPEDGDFYEEIIIDGNSTSQLGDIVEAHYGPNFRPGDSVQWPAPAKPKRVKKVRISGSATTQLGQRFVLGTPANRIYQDHDAAQYLDQVTPKKVQRAQTFPNTSRHEADDDDESDDENVEMNDADREDPEMYDSPRQGGQARGPQARREIPSGRPGDRSPASEATWSR